jgi:hypothetical protein
LRLDSHLSSFGNHTSSHYWHIALFGAPIYYDFWMRYGLVRNNTYRFRFGSLPAGLKKTFLRTTLYEYSLCIIINK